MTEDIEKFNALKARYIPLEPIWNDFSNDLDAVLTSTIVRSLDLKLVDELALILEQQGSQILEQWVRFHLSRGTCEKRLGEFKALFTQTIKFFHDSCNKIIVLERQHRALIRQPRLISAHVVEFAANPKASARKEQAEKPVEAKTPILLSAEEDEDVPDAETQAAS